MKLNHGTKSFAIVQGVFAIVKVVFGRPQYPKWFNRNAPDATNRPTRGSRRRENTTFIERVFLALLSILISFTAIGSSISRSTDKVYYASWRDQDIFLARFSSGSRSRNFGQNTSSRVIPLTDTKTFHCGLYFLIRSA